VTAPLAAQREQVVGARVQIVEPEQLVAGFLGFGKLTLMRQDGGSQQ